MDGIAQPARRARTSTSTRCSRPKVEADGLFRYHVESDYHWNVEGNRVAAEAVCGVPDRAGAGAAMKAAPVLRRARHPRRGAAGPDARPGEVLVRIGAAGVCGSDLHPYRGASPWGAQEPGPRRAGHELAGTIEALGPGVTHLAVGQRVGVEPMHLVGCGRCRQCRRGDYHVCPTRGMHNGQRRGSAGFSELDLAVAENVYPLPDVDVAGRGLAAGRRTAAASTPSIASRCGRWSTSASSGPGRSA